MLRRRVRPGTGSQGGFTLLEVLVAMAISSVVVLAAYAALTGGLGVYTRAGAATEEVQVARTVAERLTRELQGACFRPQVPDLVFVGEEAEETDDGLGSRLEFVTTAGRAPLERVVYFLQEEDRDTGRPGGLYRLGKPLLDRRSDEVSYQEDLDETEAVLVAPEVTDFGAVYYDLQSRAASSGLGLSRSLTGEDAWEESWDAQTEGRLPGAVRLTFWLRPWAGNDSAAEEDGEADGKGRQYSLLVLLPTAQSAAAEEEEPGGGP